LQRKDECGQRGAGHQAVLEQLQSEIVRGEALRGDAGADYCRDQECRADQLGDCAPRLIGHPLAGLIVQGI
jgi:hypothetical protein